MKVNMFKVWMELMRFNGKEVMKAGSLIGISTPNTASSRFTGKSDADTTELLAMSAVAAGLKPWSPDYHGHLVGLKDLQQIIENRAVELAAARHDKQASAPQGLRSVKS